MTHAASRTTAPNNVLDFLLGFFGCAAEEDLTVVLPNADDEQLQALAHAYQEFTAASWKVMNPLPAGELRPFVQTSSIYDAPAWARGGFEFGSDELQSVDSTFRLVDQIKHRLLYCHSVALDDPLWQFVSLAEAQARLRRNKAPQGDSAAEALRNYANLLLHLRVLLRKQIVCPVFTPNLLSGAGHAARADRRAVEAEVDRILDNDAARARLDFDELIDAAPPENADRLRSQLRAGAKDQELLRDVFGGIARQRLATALCSAIESEGRTTLYLPFRNDVESLKACIDNAESLRQSTARLGRDESYVMSPLLDLQLPGLASLTPEEIIALRETAGEFEKWRTDLRQALLAAEAVPPGVRDRSGEMQRVVHDRMNESLDRLKSALPKSPFLRAARIGTTALVGGTLGAVVTAALDPTGSTALITMGMILGQLASAGYATLADLGEAAGGTSAAAVAARHAHYVAVLR